MDTALSQKELEEMLDRAVQEVTERTVGVRLCQSGEELSEDLFTVHTTFVKGFHTSLSLCIDSTLLARMARNSMKSDALTSQDLEEVGKEYVNILCGKIAAALFRATRVAARFSVPTFHRGRYVPENYQMQFVLTYSDDRRDGAQLIHHVPCPQGHTAKPT